MELWEAALGLVGVIVTAYLTYKGVKYTGKQSAQAAQETRDDEKRRDAIDGFDRLVEKLFQKQEQQEQEIGSLKTELQQIKERQAATERELEQERIVRRAAIRHIHYLHSLIDAHPPLPSELLPYFAERSAGNYKPRHTPTKENTNDADTNTP